VDHAEVDVGIAPGDLFDAVVEEGVAGEVAPQHDLPPPGELEHAAHHWGDHQCQRLGGVLARQGRDPHLDITPDR
jgi:hypothetical protein